MRTIFAKLVILSSLLLGLVAPLSVSAAYNPLGAACSGNGRDSAACQDARTAGEDPIAGPNGVIVRATNIVAIIAGIAAVIYLVLAGIKYITSQGAPDQISKAKESIIYALVGIVFILLARSIITFIIGRI
jgi:hypothetical protein